ncbi:EscU/YscU/HrcU family type III secretion system export apparatus switch protein [Oleiharenicola lentus]|jgi:flagellar biosynthetic protein FlhB|uniref:EscU/YscU/HrcU family type III secretion system export apparatus switch protein n=1 Tax=Oleiharenicola lentus TaxID=2508720 RepID=A0A4Q1C3X5_9BACT|nr:EscU/YscU/HrcU family type III secretion system export apparatus switch protein [Oleiharenicola lentus]RXK52955.1 EscU/YscU/HrcU family type III secretion system export apparatus switch protein [Oleiharenicola lentus]
MSDTDQDQKTEQPTGKRLNEAADKGQFAKSPEMSVLFSLAAALGVLGFTASSTARHVAEYTVGIFSTFGRSPVELATVPGYLHDVFLTVGEGLLPVLLACAVAALLVGGIQSGFRASPKAIGFKLESLNPVAGFGRIFSKATLVRAGLDLLKLIAIGFTLFLGARTLLGDPLFSAPVEAAYLGTFLNNAALSFFSRLLLSLGVIAALSYAWEKYKTGQDLMMTRQEVKDEHKNQEGDGHVKGAMRRMARRLLQKQMLDSVATADVVVTNPTHFAVVLKYERGVDKAPIVLAKGENRFAQRLKALAAQHGVPTVENKPVARLLFAMGEVGEAIPPGLYQAVAEILAVVYRTHRFYFHQLKTRRLETAA